MIGYPKTIEEAKEYRYGIRIQSPAGEPYHKEHCAYEIAFDFHYHLQCSRKKGHGPGSLYCKRHAKIIKAME